MEMYQLLEETQHQAKKKSGKIKSLKKERDALKIEMLKLKQIYSEKCDNYKDTRIKLQKKLKKREDNLSQLEEKVQQYERYYKKKIQNDHKTGGEQLPQWAREYQGTTGKFGNQFEQSN